MGNVMPLVYIYSKLSYIFKYKWEHNKKTIYNIINIQINEKIRIIYPSNSGEVLKFEHLFITSCASCLILSYGAGCSTSSVK